MGFLQSILKRKGVRSSSAMLSVFLNVDIMVRAPTAILDQEVTLGKEDTSGNTIR